MSDDADKTVHWGERCQRWGIVVLVIIVLGRLISSPEWWGERRLTTAPSSLVGAAADGPRCIVSLAPSITETLYALELGERVCGVTDYCDFPADAKTKPSVGGYLRPAYERILTLQPDLILALPEHTRGKADLHRLNIRVETVDNKTIADILNTITAVGQYCGKSAESVALRRSITDSLRRIRNQTVRTQQPRVLVAIGRTVGQRGIAGVYVAGTGSFHDELIRLAGGRNAVDAGDYPMVSAEGVIRIDPDVIIDLVPEEMTPTETARYADDWRMLSSLRAVTNNRIHLLGGNHVLIPGPRFVAVVEQLHSILHPSK